MSSSHSKRINIKTKKPSSAKRGKLPELIALEGVVGDFMQYWGFKKIHGRIWTHLYTSKVPLDTEQLMERLQVSKGLMSLAMRELLDYKVIHETSIGRHGSVFYSANPNLQAVIFNVLKTRETKMLNETKNILDKLIKVKNSEFQKSEIDRDRVRDVLTLTESSLGLLQFFLQSQQHQGADIFHELSPAKNLT